MLGGARWLHCLPHQRVSGGAAVGGAETGGAVETRGAGLPAINHHAKLYNYLGT